MERPTARARPGGSRREIRARLFAGALGVGAVLFGGALLALSRFDPDRFLMLRQSADDAIAAVGGVVGEPIARVSDAWGAAADYPDAVARVGRLESELVKVRQQAARADLYASENARLKRLLAFHEASVRRIAVARISGASGAGLVESAVVSAGTDAGVEPGQPVVIDSGLIGRVTEVGRTAARVLLVSDDGSRVPVRIVRTGVTALLAGVGGGMTELRFVGGDPNAGPRVGDLIVTSGEGGLFAPDVPVARVTQLRGDAARAQALALPDTLGLAVIEAAWMPPPAPVPAANAAGKPVPMAGLANP